MGEIWTEIYVELDQNSNDRSIKELELDSCNRKRFGLDRKLELDSWSCNFTRRHYCSLGVQLGNNSYQSREGPEFRPLSFEGILLLLSLSDPFLERKVVNLSVKDESETFSGPSERVIVHLNCIVTFAHIHTTYRSKDDV